MISLCKNTKKRLPVTSSAAIVEKVEVSSSSVTSLSVVSISSVVSGIDSAVGVSLCVSVGKFTSSYYCDKKIYTEQQ